MADNQHVLAGMGAQLGDEFVHIIGGDDGGLEVEQLGQWCGGLLGAFDIGHEDCFDISVAQRLGQASGALVSFVAEESIRCLRELLGMADDEDGLGGEGSG